MKWFLAVILFATALHAADPKAKRATGEIIRTKGKIQTGSSSRIELELPYLAIVRIGSNADFSFSPDAKSLSLSNGTMLMSMAVETSGVSVEIGSTVVGMSKGDFEALNLGGRVKVITLNGKVAVALAANPSDKKRLRAGQMMDVPAGATQLPPVTAIKLSSLIKTSILFNMGPLPSSRAIRQNATSQQPPRPFVTGGFDPDFNNGGLLTIGPPGTVAGLVQMRDARAAQVISVLGPNSNVIPTGAQLATLEEAGKPLPPSNRRALELNRGRPATVPGQTPRPQPTRPPVITLPIATPRPFPTRPPRPGNELPGRPPVFRPPIAVP